MATLYLTRIVYNFAQDNVIARTAHYQSFDGEIREDTETVTITMDDLALLQHHIGGLIYSRGLGDITPEHFDVTRQHLLRLAYAANCPDDKLALAFAFHDDEPRYFNVHTG